VAPWQQLVGVGWVAVAAIGGRGGDVMTLMGGSWSNIYSGNS